MKTATEKIYLNEAGRFQKAPKTAEYREYAEEFDQVYDELYETLNKDQKALLEQLYVCNGMIDAYMSSLYFRKGLNLGLRLGLESYLDDELWND